MKHYFITGGAGFIGSHLTEKLVGSGNAVTVLDDLSTGSLANLRAVIGNPKLRFVKGDILNRATVTELAEHCDEIIHLAGAVGVRRILTDPLDGMRVNTAGTESVLEAAQQAGKKVLLASTSEVYGKSNLPQLCEETDTVLGSSALSRWSYATSKRLDEHMALAYFSKYGLPVIVVRLFNMVGPRQNREYGSVLPNFVHSALTGRPIRVFGDGRQTRNFTAVSDCVEAFLKLLATPRAEGQVFNIGAPNQTSIMALAEQVKALSGSRSEIVLVPYEEAYPEGGFEDMQSRTPCICKIRSYTGWEPKVNLEQIITRTIAAFKPTRIGVQVITDVVAGKSRQRTGTMNREAVS